VANGVPEVKRVSHYVTRKKGGEGAIREIVDLMLKILGKRKAVLTSILSDRKEERK
jgi:3-deoxy-D-manno-octulosonate 8-phosphate phosphatase (KDO 8-P phosphatase)